MKTAAGPQPNLPVMAIVFTAALLGAFIVFFLSSALLHELAKFEKHSSVIIGCLTAAIWTAAAGYRIGTSASYRSSKPYSARIFHIWQCVVLGLTFGFAYLTGAGESSVLQWFAAVVECILVLFYLSVVGFGLALKQRLGASIYWGLIMVVCSAAYAIWKAPK